LGIDYGKPSSDLNPWSSESTPLYGPTRPDTMRENYVLTM
jgi:hypothetical protein